MEEQICSVERKIHLLIEELIVIKRMKVKVMKKVNNKGMRKQQQSVQVVALATIHVVDVANASRAHGEIATGAMVRSDAEAPAIVAEQVVTPI